MVNNKKQNAKKQQLQQQQSNNLEELAKTIAAVANDTTGRTQCIEAEKNSVKKLPTTKCPTNILAANFSIQQRVKTGVLIKFL